MSISSYIKDNQKILYQTFYNALSQDKVAHVYLLCGVKGIPLKEIAIYLGKSLMCDHPTPFADEECKTCKRIDSNNVPDFLVLDGKNESIKRGDVDNLIDAFSSSSFEDRDIKVYIINQIENAVPEALNGLLKFLEEPPAHTYGILTTENVNKILPTIISRCQVVKLVPVPREKVISGSLELKIEQKDAELLSFLCNDPAIIASLVDEDSYQNLKDAFEETIYNFSLGEATSRFILETKVLPLLNKKPILRDYFDLLTYFFEDLLSFKEGGSIKLNNYAKLIKDLAIDLPHLDNTLLGIMKIKREIELNINSALLLFRLNCLIFEE